MPRTVGTHDAEAGSSRAKPSSQYETVEEVMLPRVHHEFLLWGTSTKAAKTRYNTNLACLLPKQIYSPCVVDCGVLNCMGVLRKCLRSKCMMWEDKNKFSVLKLGGEVLISMNLFTPSYVMNFTPPTSLMRISSEEELHLSRSLASTIRSPILRVLQKMITYGLCQRTTGMAKRMRLLTDEVLNGLSALTFCRALDATTLRELVDSNGRLIAEDPAPGVPRVAMPKPSRTSMQDLYDRMGNMEIRQGVLERMTDRQSYQFDKYARVFEYMVGQHGVPLQGAYAPPGYHEEQQED
ncbi:hypothetical protein Tco_0392414 [Tanacetum coccineum]